MCGPATGTGSGSVSSTSTGSVYSDSGSFGYGTAIGIGSQAGTRPRPGSISGSDAAYGGRKRFGGLGRHIRARGRAHDCAPGDLAAYRG